MSMLLAAIMLVAMIPVIAFPTTAGTQPGFTSASVALGSDITVNYYAVADEVPVAKFTMNGKETTITGVATDNPNEYKFAFTGVAPQCMGDNIVAELYIDGELIDTKAEYSVLENVTSNDVLNDDNKQLIYDLLAYGAAAQKYAGYKTDDLVNAGYENLATPYSPISNNDRTVGDAIVLGGMFSAVGVYYGNANRIYAKVTLTDHVGFFDMYIDGKEVEFEETNTEGVYIVYTEDIKVTDFDKVFTFELTDGMDTQTLTYSVNAYAKVKSENAKTNAAKELARALYAYGVSAEEMIYGPINVGGEYEHVVIIGVDGAGAFFNQTSTPNIDAIFEGGAITYTCQAATPSMSAQGWANILHGVTPFYHGCTNTNTESTPYPSDSDYPSIFRIIREQDQDAVLASFTNWDNINVGIIENDIGVTKVSTNYKPGGDAELTDKICDYVAENDPTLLFVQFDEVDYAGENLGGFGRESHLAQITTTDGYIKRIYDAYAEKGILEDTLFIVTADHGGIAIQNNTPTDKSWYGTHGGASEEEMNVMFAAAGKTVQENSTIGSMNLCDTAAITLHALGYEATTDWGARVPSGLFNGVTAPGDHENLPTPDEKPDIDNELQYYLPLDGEAFNEGTIDTDVTEHGDINYVEGYYGEGAALKDGYISIDDYAPGRDSFTVGFWIKTDGVSGDPCILSNKNWDGGRNPGYAIIYNGSSNIKLNAGNGTGRMDYYSTLPIDQRDDWMHVLVRVDRDAGEIGFRYNFGNEVVQYETTSDEDRNYSKIGNASLTTDYPLNIGQDGRGTYGCSLDATVDELMIFSGVLTDEELAELAAYYGKEIPRPEETPIDNEIKYYLPFDGSLNNEGSVDAEVTENGSLSFIEGYEGQGVYLKDGFVSINDYAPGTDSFTIAFWLKTTGAMNTYEGDKDPCIVSSSSWHSGRNRGLTLAYRDDYKGVRFNIADGSERAYIDAGLPYDFDEGWTHIIATVDRENGKLYMRYNFGPAFSADIPAAMKESSLTSSYALNIGHDGSGTYTNKLTDAVVDEFILFDGILSDSEVIRLASNYTKEETPPEDTPSDDIPTEETEIDNELKYYLPFDGDAINEGTVDTTVTEHGNVEYTEGYVGEGIVLSDGYVSIDEYVPEDIGSFTIAFWMRTEGIDGDPCVISNKDWASGRNKGIALCITNEKLRFNMSDGSGRVDYDASLPSGFRNGWVHVIVTVDIENDKIGIRYNFGSYSGGYYNNEYKINTDFSTSYPLNIGQDGTGSYGNSVDAIIDEFMIFEGVLTDGEVASLSASYAK